MVPPEPCALNVRAACLIPRKTPRSKHAERPVPVAGLDLGDRAEGATDTRVVHHHVEVAELLDRGRDARGHVVLDGHVGAGEAEALVVQLVGERRAGAGVVVGGHDGRVFREEAQHRGATDPVRAAGDDHDPAVEAPRRWRRSAVGGGGRVRRVLSRGGGRSGGRRRRCLGRRGRRRRGRRRRGRRRRGRRRRGGWGRLRGCCGRVGRGRRGRCRRCRGGRGRRRSGGRRRSAALVPLLLLADAVLLPANLCQRSSAHGDESVRPT